MVHGSVWLDEHLESFVRPKLGSIPEIPKPVKGSYTDIDQFKKSHLIGLQVLWKEAKRLTGSRAMLLAGRDVFLLELLARLEGYPTTFRPDISSSSCKHVTEDYKEYYLIDTGYKGSVPKALGMQHFAMIKYDVYPPSVEHQLFPRVTRQFSPIRTLAPMLERVAKYWTRALFQNGKIQQTLEADPTFKLAAQLTRFIASHTKYPHTRTYVRSIGRGI